MANDSGTSNSFAVKYSLTSGKRIGKADVFVVISLWLVIFGFVSLHSQGELEIIEFSMGIYR